MKAAQRAGVGESGSTRGAMGSATTREEEEEEGGREDAAQRSGVGESGSTRGAMGRGSATTPCCCLLVKFTPDVNTIHTPTRY